MYKLKKDDKIMLPDGGWITISYIGRYRVKVKVSHPKPGYHVEQQKDGSLVLKTLTDGSGRA